MIDDIEKKPFKCDICNTHFVSTRNLERHNKTCDGTERGTASLKLIDNSNNVVNNTTNNNSNNVVNNTTNNNSNNVVNNIDNSVNTTVNNTIVLKCFGQEDLDFIRNDEAFLRECLLSLKDGIAAIVERIHFNTDKPENHNIYLKRERYPGQVKTYCTDINTSSEDWRNKPLDYILEFSIFRGVNLLSVHNRNRISLLRQPILDSIAAAKDGLPTDAQQEQLDLVEEKQNLKNAQLQDIRNKKVGVYGQVKEATLEKLRVFTATH
jgi:hypothetical protein